ncbi:Ig-like domain-containing protein, partial [Pseudomonas sp. FW305-BF6]|uniref:Ig-like domain-containing protein n=1 Tax=Pseudomonas sp. FW305-BF6 TaxID=2070673 RepID=UPI001C48D8C3
ILPSAIFTLAGLDSQAAVTVSKASLSEDGKTLTLTTTAAVANRYDLVIDGLKAANGKTLPKYQHVVTLAADTTAPTIVSTVKTSASTFKVTFSEPLNSLGTVTYKLADGSTAVVTEDLAPGAKEVTFTLDAGIAAGKVVTATFVG